MWIHVHLHSQTCTHTIATAHLVPIEIPYDKIQIGPAFPSMGGLILEFPTFELAMRISEALEETSSKATVMSLPTIYVRGRWY